MRRRITVIIMAVLLAFIALPSFAFAMDKDDIAALLEQTNLPVNMVKIFKSTKAPADITSAQWDYAAEKIKAADKILGDRDVSELSHDESVEIMNLAAAAIENAGFTMKYTWLAEGGAKITIYDKSGKPFIVLNTRDSGVNQTGEQSPYIVWVCVFAVLTVLSVICLTRTRHYEE